MSLTFDEVVRERETAREELKRVVAKQVKVRDENEAQRVALERINAREQDALRALMGHCDNCERMAKVIVRTTHRHPLIRMCYEHADAHWNHRHEAKASALGRLSDPQMAQAPGNFSPIEQADTEQGGG